MKLILKGIVAVGLILYPFLVGYSLAHGQYIWVSSLLIILGLLRLFSKGNALLWPLTGFAVLCGSLSLILKDHAWLKLYPVFMSVGACMIFASTLVKPPSMIEVLYNGFISYLLMGLLLLGEFILRKRQQRLNQIQE